MKTERKGVDVLAVMLALIVEVDADENESLYLSGKEARAAVAELIEATRDYLRTTSAHDCKRMVSALERCEATR